MRSEVEVLLVKLAEVDPKSAMWCACQCVRTVLPLVPEGEDRPKRAVDTTEAWLRGDIPHTAVVAAAEAVEAASRQYETNTPPRIVVSGAYKVTQAERAADAAYCAATAAYATTNPDNLYDPSDELTQRLSSLFELVSSLSWPLTAPTRDQLQRAPTSVQVSWDLVAEPRTVHTIPDLLRAHGRARDLALDWNDPVARAVAERTTDARLEQRVRQLLQTETERPEADAGG